MGIKDTLKVSRKTFFNPRAWLGYDSLKDQTKIIGGFVKGAMTVQNPERPSETFEEALQRLNITKEDLDIKARVFFGYAMFFLSLAVVDFIWAFYLLFHERVILGFIMALAVCALLLAQVFRYHFWYYQIKKRKLGCTYQEWRDDLLGRKGKSS